MGPGRVTHAPVIELVLVDDHPAVLAGLVSLIGSERGLSCRAAATSAAEARDAVRRMEPEVVLADYELPDGDGLRLCAELKALPAPPGVIVYSAFARPRLLPAAAVAGADAMLDKGVPADELFATIRHVACGEAGLPSAPPEALERSLRKLSPDDIALFGMAINGMAVRDIAAVTGTNLDETQRRLRILLGRLQEQTVGPARR